MYMQDNIDRNTLVEQFERVLRGNHGDNVDVSKSKSSDISKTLRRFVYRESGPLPYPVYARARYNDGSRGKPFQLRSLQPRNKDYEPLLRTLLPVRVAMISMRHYELDTLVDYAWILNKDIPPHRSLAYVEEFSYERTRQQLREALDQAPLKLHFYQTGYQPVAVGFYRALTDELLARVLQKPVLEVVPYYYSFLMNYYPHGQPWN